MKERLEAAWARIPAGAAAPWGVPRAGLGGSVVAHVARGWGARRWQEAGRVAIAAVEAVNQRVHLGVPDGTARRAWLEADLRVATGVARQVARRDETLIRRVLDRVTGGPRPGEDASPEAVLFLRGAVAAGVVVGAVPDGVHARLDAWAIALGTAMEQVERGQSASRALEDAARALDDVPDADARERMLAVLDPGPTATGARRDPEGWTPFFVTARGRPDEAIIGAMDALLDGEGPLREAARWLAGTGGKRVRARIVLGAARAMGHDEGARLPAAAALEWVHAASLVLDDIVDGADLRRGEPALHRATSGPFAAGTAAWILARVAVTHPGLADAMLALAEGQRAELAREGDVGMGLAEWYAIAGAKTAKLFAAAATTGGAGANRRELRALGRYGHELGLAFQIVDDLLDLVGDETHLGKRPGQDIRAGRVTFPMLLLREREPGALGGGEAELLAALARHDVAAACRDRARVHGERARAALRDLPGDTLELHALVDLCVERAT
jgi:octaprenyl-diphosphate synthase